MESFDSVSLSKLSKPLSFSPFPLRAVRVPRAWMPQVNGAGGIGEKNIPPGGAKPYPVGACIGTRVDGYSGGMDTLNFPLPNQLYLVVAPHAARIHMLDLAARLALRGSVRILDAGNQCNIYPIAQRLRQATHDVNAALQRIQIQRAFTCYQVATLLGEARPAATATLVLDFLSTFYDQDVKLPEATRLLRGCLTELLRLAEGAPVLVSARVPLAACAERQPLLELLRAAAAQRWEMDEAQPVAGPPSLFLEAAEGKGKGISPFSAARPVGRRRRSRAPAGRPVRALAQPRAARAVIR